MRFLLDRTYNVLPLLVSDALPIKYLLTNITNQVQFCYSFGWKLEIKVWEWRLVDRQI